jgi:hypothetical protein
VVAVKYRKLSVFVAVLTIGLVACGHTAGSPHGSLKGETARSIRSTDGTTSNCNTGSDGTFTFAVSGKTAGPYAGTFTAHGEVTLSKGAITSMNEEFKIISGTATVNGHLVSVTGTTTGICVPDYGLASSAYRYQAVISQGGQSSNSFEGSGFLSVSGGSTDASQLFADFG